MATLSGQKTVAAAGTAEGLVAASQKVNGAVMVKALPGNTGIVYVGHVDGDVDSSTGMPLLAGEVLIFNQVGDLLSVWVDSAVNDEGVAWLALDC